MVSLRISANKTFHPSIGYGGIDDAHWDTPPTTFRHEDIQHTMEQYHSNLADAKDVEVKLLADLASVRKMLADKTAVSKKTTATKVKAVPKYITQAGANAKAQRRLQGAGKLEPFRSGGCRCRVWGNGLGNQCHAKAKIDGFCASHAKKIALDPEDQWTMGFYDTDRPTKWGECGALPKDRKAGGVIAWKMDDETFATAFANQSELDQAGEVVLDIEAPEGSDTASDISNAETMVLTDESEEDTRDTEPFAPVEPTEDDPIEEEPTEDEQDESEGEYSDQEQ